MKSYIYVFVRNDLTAPQKAVQACHAVLEACWPFHLDDLEHPSVILLGVENEEELDRIEEDLPYYFHYEVFREPHYGNSKTALAVYPVTEADRKWFKDFKLMK
jgi:hypothetical protein